MIMPWLPQGPLEIQPAAGLLPSQLSLVLMANWIPTYYRSLSRGLSEVCLGRLPVRGQEESHKVRSGGQEQTLASVRVVCYGLQGHHHPSLPPMWVGGAAVSRTS